MKRVCGIFCNNRLSISQHISDSLLGVLFGGLFGYRDAPVVGELGIYLVFTIPALILFLMPHRVTPAPRTANSSKKGEFRINRHLCCFYCSLAHYRRLH